LVRRIEPVGHPVLFEARIGDNHHHLICRSCGTVLDLDCAVDTVPCLQPSQDRGFVIDEAEVSWCGRCRDCQIANAS
jgi:Fur family ferric uptake transcriptional regulator